MAENKKYTLGITLGDMNGIGPEIILKTFSDSRMLDFFTPVLYGSSKIISYYRKLLNVGAFNFNQVRSIDRLQPHAFNIVNLWEGDVTVQPGQSTEAGGRNAFLSIQAAVNDLKENRIDALVTAPINKKNIASDQFPFNGHTGYLAAQAGVNDHLMMMSGENSRVALVTEHVPVKDISTYIKKNIIAKKIEILQKSLCQDFGFEKPKIAVLGLNPHAGDEGLIGREEIEEIRPAILDCKQKNWFVQGPFSADGFFASGANLKYDATLAMYHDQGLIPFKQLSFDTGVNFTAGLPFVRTSPDHGVGYDIAGKNLAREDSFRAACFLAIDILKQRERYKEMTSNPIKKTELAKESTH